MSGKYTINDIIRQDVESVLMMTYTNIPAIVQSHDTTAQTLTVKVAVETPTYYGDNIAPCTLEDVPIIFPSGANWVMAGVLERGDSVMLIIPHYGIDEYLQGDKGSVGKPLTVRRHDLNEAVAIPGMMTFKSPTRKLALKDKFHIAQGDNNHITFDDSGGIVITSGASVVTVNDSGVNITAPTTTVTGNLVVTGTASVGGIPMGTHTHPYTDNGSGLVTGPPA